MVCHNDKKLCIVDFHSTICGHGKIVFHQLVNLVKSMVLKKVILIKCEYGQISSK